jgi:regulator of protease activity HflC (stomatin/prohibitin superfamily)
LLYLIIHFAKNKVIIYNLNNLINQIYMLEIFGTLSTIGLPLLIFLVLVSIKQINQYERGVKFTLGKFTEVVQPGWRIIIPIFQGLTKIDVRTKAVDVPDQEAITLDNISIGINAVIYYKVVDASRAVIEVENYYYAISQLAQTTMRNIVGTVDLDTLLRSRDVIAQKIQVIVDTSSDEWGIKVESVELKDIRLPDNLKRTMAKEAEAEREKRAILIRASAELESADNMSKAADRLANSPGALHLRTLQSINDISSDQSNTTIWMVPLEGLRALEGLANLAKK